MRGYSFVEVVAAATLLGITLLASTGLLLNWHHATRVIEERAVAEHALEQEMEWLLLDLAPLPTGTSAWRSGADEGCGLSGASGSLSVEPLENSRLRRVLVTLRWEGGEASRETLVRARR